MVYTPPMNISLRDISKKSIFLGGSIEMGKAENWQIDMIKFLEPFDFEIFNPRREDWESTWKLPYENGNFYQQVNWELNALEHADIILMNFIPDTLSPISLLEMGLFGVDANIHVVCPDGYWRKGNVDVVCDRYSIPLYNTLDDFKRFIKTMY